ncbi:YcaO-like family protein [Nakamurella sp. PAMC28650]|uniref:YcaO-like family protein n=1 Tax=Nakamurella sp. PAMC28650 TaxID=2762325 RepID=UPI00164D2561|nr:YcaO-like family protein [Nakamurella sp. PAMC28650]QNK82119.1 YcaO-like family protein [Nakamurella sp. PAMC28650]
MNTAVMINGVSYTAEKGFYRGTQRTAPPEQTLERIRAVAPTVGLTRLADVTGLDRIGIPTVVGYRPNSPTLTVSGGKGFTTLAAMVSAGMEAVEIWHAENLLLDVVVDTHAALDDLGLTSPSHQLPLTGNSLFDPHRAEPWVTGWDLMTQKSVAVPYAIVSMGNTKHFPTRRWMPFVPGSNGLAGGNHLLEAVAAALYEVVERDAVACSRMVGSGLDRRVDLDTVIDPLVRSLIDQFEAADVSVYLYDCTVDTRVPTYMSVVADRIDPAMGLYRGYGAHLDPSIAMIRALTESAQARLLLIAGSRDDYFTRDQRINRFMSDGRREIFDSIPATVSAAEQLSAATSSFGDDITVVLDRLRAAGLESAIVVDLTHPDLQIPVVRVIVPGLEGYIFDYYRPGPRALAHAHQTAVVS